MSLRIFKGGELMETGEREQAYKMIEYLTPFFNERGSDVFIVVNPLFNVNSPQIDCLFYRQGRIVILELKNIHGSFIPVADEEKPWIAISNEGITKEIEKQNKNPFEQVKHQRGFLIRYFIHNVLDHSDISGNEMIAKIIGDNISGWIVTAENSKPEEYDKIGKYWSDVVPIGKMLSTALSTIGTAKKDSIDEEKFKKFLSKIGAKETSLENLFFKGVVPEYESGKVPTVEILLKSNNEEENRTAIKYCRELNLLRYFDDLTALSIIAPTTVRFDAFSLLFEWLNRFQQKFPISDKYLVVKRSIIDSDFNIRKMAYQFLLNSPFKMDKNLQKIVEGILVEETNGELIVLNLKTFEFMENIQNAELTLKNFYNQKIGLSFFYWLKESKKLNKTYSKQLKYTRDNKQEGTEDKTELRNEMDKARIQSKLWIDIANAWIDVSSTLKSKTLAALVLEHLKRVVEEFEPPQNSDLTPTPTIRESIKALAKIGSEEARNYLRKTLLSSTNEYILYDTIEALGELQDNDSSDQLMNLLKNVDENNSIDTNYIKILASDALSRIGIVESFDLIWELFLLDVNKESVSEEGKSYFNSLRRLNRVKLEKKLWETIEENGYNTQTFETYGESIKQCGGKYTIDKCKQLILERNLKIDNFYKSPEGILRYVFWANPTMGDAGVKLGLELLKTGRKELEMTGLDLAESYMLNNVKELEKYEYSENEDTRYLVSMMYCKLRNQDKVESAIIYEIEKDAFPSAYLLETLIPEKCFKSYYIVGDGNVQECEFVVGNSGLFVTTFPIHGHTSATEKLQFIPWNNFSAYRKFGIQNIIVGLLIKTKEEKISSLMPREAVSWNSLVGNKKVNEAGINCIVNGIENNVSAGIGQQEVAATSDSLYEILKSAYIQEETHSFGGNVQEKIEMFSNRFKTEMMKLI